MCVYVYLLSSEFKPPPLTSSTSRSDDVFDAASTSSSLLDVSVLLHDLQGVRAIAPIALDNLSILKERSVADFIAVTREGHLGDIPVHDETASRVWLCKVGGIPSILERLALVDFCQDSGQILSKLFERFLRIGDDLDEGFAIIPVVAPQGTIFSWVTRVTHKVTEGDTKAINAVVRSVFQKFDQVNQVGLVVRVISRVRTLSGLYLCHPLDETRPFPIDDKLLVEESRLARMEEELMEHRRNNM